jgi:hypothetical protein
VNQTNRVSFVVACSPLDFLSNTHPTFPDSPKAKGSSRYRDGDGSVAHERYIGTLISNNKQSLLHIGDTREF